MQYIQAKKKKDLQKNQPEKKKMEHLIKRMKNLKNFVLEFVFLFLLESFIVCFRLSRGGKPPGTQHLHPCIMTKKITSNQRQWSATVCRCALFVV